MTLSMQAKAPRFVHTVSDFLDEHVILKLLDLDRAPYVLYGVNYIALVSLW